MSALWNQTSPCNQFCIPTLQEYTKLFLVSDKHFHEIRHREGCQGQNKELWISAEQCDSLTGDIVHFKKFKIYFMQTAVEMDKSCTDLTVKRTVKVTYPTPFVADHAVQNS